MNVAIYCRLSEEDKNKTFASDDSNSIQNQKTMLLQYALEHQWDVYQIYSDDDYTGADRRRPAFNQLLDDARARKFHIVLCKTQSRFTREVELVEKYIHGLFPLWGIRFISIVDNADTDNKGNKKSRQINALVNEWYLEDMSENIRSVLTSRRKNGYHIGSFALYGYKKDPQKKGHLIIDEEAAQTVRQVFSLFASGYGKTAIARILNDQNIPNPTEYKRLQGLRYQQPKQKNSTLWKYAAIADMLENETYIGNLVQGKYGSISYKTKQNKPRPKEAWYRTENTHEPIIDRQLWDSVQALLAQKAKPFSSGTIGLFARKARCCFCGCTMRSTSTHGRRYLTCPNHSIAKDACPGAFISVDKLEQTVLKELHRLIDLYLDQEEFNKNIHGISALKHPLTDLQKQKKCLTDNLSAWCSKIAEYEQALCSLYLDKANNILSESDFLSLSRHFTCEKEQLSQYITDAQNQLKKMEEKEATLKASISQIETAPESLAKTYIHPQHLSREMVELLIDYIFVSKRICGTRDVPIEIHWKL